MSSDSTMTSPRLTPIRYSIRVGFALDTSSSLVGLYVDYLGWQWLYWQSVVNAPLMGPRMDGTSSAPSNGR